MPRVRFVRVLSRFCIAEMSVRHIKISHLLLSSSPWSPVLITIGYFLQLSTRASHLYFSRGKSKVNSSGSSSFTRRYYNTHRLFLRYLSGAPTHGRAVCLPLAFSCPIFSGKTASEHRATAFAVHAR